MVEYIEHQLVSGDNVPHQVLQALRAGHFVARFFEDSDPCWEIYRLDGADKLHIALVDSLDLSREDFNKLNYAVTDMRLHFRLNDSWEIISTEIVENKCETIRLAPRTSQELNDEIETDAFNKIDVKINGIYDILNDIESIARHEVSNPKIQKKITDKCDKIEEKVTSFHRYIDNL